MNKTDDAKGLLERMQSLMGDERWRDAIKLLKRGSVPIEKHWDLLWNLGWCYLKLDQVNEAHKYLARAARLEPNRFACKFGLGVVYLEKKSYKKAEALLVEALEMKKHDYTAQICVALAYRAQGKLKEAEKIHLDGIRLKPKESRRYESYAAFLSDIGREAEAARMTRKARELQRLN